MPSVVVDSVLVEAGWDPTALERGLARSERLVQEFATAHPAITLTVNGQDVVRQVEQIRQNVKAAAQSSPITIPTTTVVPPTVPPPDFTQTIAEATRAAAIVREEFESALRGASTMMAADAFKAGIRAGRELQAGLIGQIQGLGKQVAAGLISIPQATAQIDAAIQAMSVEAKRLQGAIPPIQIRTVVMPEGARGVTTGTSPSVIPTAELDEAERKFDELSGAAEATNQTFVRVGSSSSAMRMGVRQATSSLTVLATQALGTNSAVGRLAQSVVLLGTGFAGTEGKIGAVLGKIGIGAGVVLGLAKAYEFLNTAQSEAQKTQDDLVAGLVAEASAMSAAEKAARGLAAALQAKAEAESFGRRTSDLLKGAGLQAIGLPGAGAEFDRRRQQEVANATMAVTQAQQDQAKAFTDTHAAEVAALTEGISLRIATTKEIQRGADFLPILTRLSEDSNLPLAERIAFLKQITGLQAALATAPSAAPGDAAIVALGRQVAVLQIGEAAVKRLEAAQAALFSGQQKGIGALDSVRERLERQKKAAEDAARAFAAIDIGQQLAEAIQSLDDALGVARRIPIFLDTKVVDKQLADLLVKIQKAQAERFTSSLGNIPLPETTIPAGFDRAQESVKGLEDELLRAIAASGKFGAAVVKAANDGRNANQRLNDGIHEITRSLDGVVGAARNIGLIGDEATRAIGSLLDLGDAIGNVVEKASAANIVGLVGAGLGAIGSIGSALGIGKSADQKAAEQALRENTQALREAAVRLSEGFRGVGGAADAANILKQVIASAAGQANIPQTQEGGDTGRAARNALVDQLAQAGLGFKDLQRLAKEFGVTILERGKLVGETLEQLTEAIRLATEAALKFGTSPADQQRVIETRDALGLGPNAGLPPDVAALSRTREVELGGLVLDPATEARIAALDLQTEAGRQAFLAFQQMLFQLAQSGQLTAEQLGTFDSVTELLGPINDAANGINAMTDAAKTAAKNLGDLNLPQGFKRAAIAFQTGDTGPDVAQLTARTAAVAAMFPAAVPAVSTKAPEIKPLPDDAQALLDRIASKAPPDLLAAVQEITATIQAGRQTTTTGDVNTTTPAAIFGGPKETRTTITFEGGITVNISGEHADPNRMADDFFAALRRKALSQSGDTLQFGVR